MVMSPRPIRIQPAPIGTRTQLPAVALEGMEHSTPATAMSTPSAPAPSGGSSERPRWWRAHPWVLDAAVVLFLVLYSLPWVIGYFPDNAVWGVGTLLSLFGLCAPVLVRRRHPLGTFLVMLVVATVHLALGLAPIPADLALLVGVYTMASRARWVRSVPVALAVLAWLLVAYVPRLATGEAVLDNLTVPIIVTGWVWTWGVLVRLRRQRAREREREWAARTRRAATEERTRIARELHDIVSHSVGTMVVVADGAARTAEADPVRASGMMVQVRETGRAAMVDMRRALDLLRDEDDAFRAPQPGLGQLDHLLRETRSTGVRVDLAVTGDSVELDAGTNLVAYRIVQEALTNARKHAGPMLSLIRVGIAYFEDGVELRISDDGQGPARSLDSLERSGHGLVGMRERVAAFGGSLDIGLRPSGGFEVRAVLPIGETA